MGLLDRWVRAALRREQVRVQDPARAWGTMLRTIGGWAVVLVAANAAIWSGGAWQVVGQLLLAGLAGVAVTTGLTRQLAYQRGWLDGRGQMVAALHEAMRRGMRPEEWLEREWERDARVLGIAPGPPLEEDPE